VIADFRGEEHPSPMPTIYTIGHSNRTIDAFLDLLAEHQIDLLVDIRTVPKSRHNPHFGQDRLPSSLAAAGIDYRYMVDLGGLRKPSPDSPNGGWRNTSFRGYADWMATSTFVTAIGELIEAAQSRRVAIMCAEAVPWRCHRSLVGDALIVRGVDVIDIIGPGSARIEQLTPFAAVDGITITYPPYEGDA
jgi:uncharacterized protein (DUF488 family)